MNTVKVKCKFCQNDFDKEAKRLNQYQKANSNFYCSKNCQSLGKTSKISFCCSQCNKNCSKVKSQINNKSNFCSLSCAATYNNTHKTKGTRVSKLEIWLQEKLLEFNQDLEFHFNRKDAINSELDIYIPSLKLAFELNGIFHYEPIFGKDKLEKIQNNDQRKFQACLEQGIELCIIDTNSMKNFKQPKAMIFLSIIKNVILRKLSQI